MSYIVKNCPCFVLGIARKGNDKKVQTCNNYRISELTHCSDITDCVIKQVIDKCRAKKLDIYNPSIGNEHYAMANSVLSTQILQLFDIEEINK